MSQPLQVCDPHFHLWDLNQRPNPNLGTAVEESLPAYLAADYLEEMGRLTAPLELSSSIHVETVVGQMEGGFVLDTVGETIISLARWPLLFVVLVLGLSMLYRYGTSRRAPRLRWVIWGSLATALLWVLVSAAFSFYLANFANYNATYGSLGAVIGFMMWLYVSLMILLLGAELNAEIEHQLITDTTVGPMRPMGERDAVMSDTLPNEGES